MKKLTMSLIKVVLLIQYSNQKTNCRKVKLILSIKKLATKSENSYFLTALNHKVLRNIKRFLEIVHLDTKIF